MNTKRRTGVLVGVSVLAVVFVYFLATSLVPKALVTLTRAAPATKTSMAKSYLLGEKILCKADGIDKCLVNVFLSDSSGRPVPGKSVSLSAGGIDVEVSPVNGVSDQMGKVSFFLVSGAEGQSEVLASVNGVPMDKTVVVTFRGK